MRKGDERLSGRIRDLSELAAQGDEAAAGELLQLHRSALKQMIQLRLNRRLQGRIDASDILQEALLEASRKLKDYLAGPRAPIYLWLRRIAADKLLEIHRNHLGTQRRDANREVSLHRGALPLADSVSLANQLMGRLTSPALALVKAELRLKLQDALNQLADLDREILSLRHFEHLSNADAAEVLGIDPSATSKRYLRALARLRGAMRELGVDDVNELFEKGH